MKGVTNLESIGHKKQKYIKFVIFIVLLIGTFILCYALISNARKEKINGGVYFGINIGMEKKDVKERLQIRAKGLDKVSFEGEDIFTLQNYHLMGNNKYYVDESFMFKGNELATIFINIKCVDTSLVEKMQKDTIEKLVEMYGEFELNNNIRCWKKDDASIQMIDNHPTRQHITVLIDKNE